MQNIVNERKDNRPKTKKNKISVIKWSLKCPTHMQTERPISTTQTTQTHTHTAERRPRRPWPSAYCKQPAKMYRYDVDKI